MIELKTGNPHRFPPAEPRSHSPIEVIVIPGCESFVENTHISKSFSPNPSKGKHSIGNLSIFGTNEVWKMNHIIPAGQSTHSISGYPLSKHDGSNVRMFLSIVEHQM